MPVYTKGLKEAAAAAAEIIDLDHGRWFSLVCKHNYARLCGVVIERFPRLLVELHRVVGHVLLGSGSEGGRRALPRVINLRERMEEVSIGAAARENGECLPWTCLWLSASK